MHLRIHIYGAHAVLLLPNVKTRVLFTTQGIQQDIEVCVSGAECFFVAFDAASNATAGAGKVSLRGATASAPAVFKARYDTAC